MVQDETQLGAERRTFRPKMANLGAGMIIGLILLVGGISATRSQTARHR